MPETGGLFIIDGESAGSTPWEFSSIVEDGTNTFSLQAAAKNHGDNGYRALMDGSNQLAYGRLNIVGQGEIYCRAYLYLSNNFDLGANYDVLGIFSLRIGGTTSISFGLRSEGATVASQWRITGTGVTGLNTNTNFSFLTWHYVELYFLQETGGGGNGVAKVWIDGDLVLDQSGISIGSGDISRIYVGSAGGATPNNGDFIYFDDIKADTSPVGAYPAAGGIVILRRRRSP